MISLIDTSFHRYKALSSKPVSSKEASTEAEPAVVVTPTVMVNERPAPPDCCRPQSKGRKRASRDGVLAQARKYRRELLGVEAVMKATGLPWLPVKAARDESRPVSDDPMQPFVCPFCCVECSVVLCGEVECNEVKCNVPKKIAKKRRTTK